MGSPLRVLCCWALLAVAGCGGEASPPPRATPEPAVRSTTSPTAAPTARPAPAIVDAAAFEAFAADLPGVVGVAVGPAGAGEPDLLGPLRGGAAWSTIKVPIALRVLEEAGDPEGLTAAQDDLIRRALTASDNAAAAALWAPLGDTDGQRAAAVEEVLRAAGDASTQVSATGRDGFSPYGQTDWALPQQYGLMARLAGGCLEDPASGRYVLSLMGAVAPDQAWGLGTIGDGASYKGGWGPGTDGRYLVRQFGTFDTGGGEVVVAMAALPDDGQFASGTRMLSEVAAYLSRHARPAPAGC